MPTKNESYMIRELKEVPNILVPGVESHTTSLQDVANKVQGKVPIICGMGSSYFLAEFGTFFLKHIAGIPDAYCSEADELMNQVPDLGDKHILIGLSQSGKSKETINAFQEAIKRWALTCAFHNNIGSPCSTISLLSIFQNIGTEKSPVSTKYIAFQFVLLYILAIILWKMRWNINKADEEKLLKDVSILSQRVLFMFQIHETKIKELAQFSKQTGFIVVWNGINAYSAQEIALKIRETTWLQATHDTEGILRHWGANSVWPEVCCMLLSSSEEIKQGLMAKGCKVVTFGSGVNNDVVIPHVNTYLDAWLMMIAGQLFVHHLSCHLNVDTDFKKW